MKRKIILIVCSIAAVLQMVFLIGYFFMKSTPEKTPEISEEPSGSETESSEEIKIDESDYQAPEKASEAGENYESPVDFELLQAENADVYAWLDIPGTDISYPVLQHPDDDSYYLRRDWKGNSDPNGVIFSEAGYNSRKFDDPVTVVYGHNMDSGQMFGTLQKVYSSPESLKEHSGIIVYMPDRELHYEVFAAVPFDNRHILYNYDLSDERTFRLLFREILSVRSLEAVFADDAAVSSDDNVLILSTCLAGNNKNRFLVCGKLSEVIPSYLKNN